MTVPSGRPLLQEPPPRDRRPRHPDPRRRRERSRSHPPGGRSRRPIAVGRPRRPGRGAGEDAAVHRQAWPGARPGVGRRRGARCGGGGRGRAGRLPQPRRPPAARGLRHPGRRVDDAGGHGLGARRLRLRPLQGRARTRQAPPGGSAGRGLGPGAPHRPRLRPGPRHGQHPGQRHGPAADRDHRARARPRPRRRYRGRRRRRAAGADLSSHPRRRPRRNDGPRAPADRDGLDGSWRRPRARPTSYSSARAWCSIREGSTSSPPRACAT